MTVASYYLIGGDDYHSGPYNITFPAGVTTVSFNISIHDDDMYEDDENFTLTINNNSLPDGIITGSPSTIIMIIKDDDSKRILIYIHILYNGLFTRCKYVN